MTAMTPHPKSPVGTLVKLRVAFGDPPPVPCVMFTDSSRRYDVVNRRGKTLHCIVMRPDAPVHDEDGPVIRWEWEANNKRVEP